MSIFERRVEVSASSLLDEIVGHKFNADLHLNREHAYMAALGDLTDAEIDEYCINLDANYPGVGGAARTALKALRDTHKLP